MPPKCARELVRNLEIEDVAVGEFLWEAGLPATKAIFILAGTAEIISPVLPLPFEVDPGHGAHLPEEPEQIELARRLGLSLPPPPGSLEAAQGRMATWSGLQSMAWEFQKKAKGMKRDLIGRHSSLEDCGGNEMSLHLPLIAAIERALEGIDEVDDKTISPICSSINYLIWTGG